MISFNASQKGWVNGTCYAEMYFSAVHGLCVLRILAPEFGCAEAKAVGMHWNRLVLQGTGIVWCFKVGKNVSGCYVVQMAGV